MRGWKSGIMSLVLCLMVTVMPLFGATVNLAWNAVTTYIDGTPITVVVSYDVWRATKVDLSDAAKVSGAGVVAVTYVDATVASGGAYWYFVRARLPNGLESTNSNVATAVLKTPASPTGVTGVIVP